MNAFLKTPGPLALELLAVDGRCERNTDGDGNCGQPSCPICGIYFIRSLTQEEAQKIKASNEANTMRTIKVLDDPIKPWPIMRRHFGGVESMGTHERLDALWERVYRLMKDAEWRTLASIQRACGGTEASCSARLRDMRKVGFGSHVVNKDEVAPGLFLYQLVLNERDAERQAIAYYYAKHPRQRYHCFVCGIIETGKTSFCEHLQGHPELFQPKAAK